MTWVPVDINAPLFANAEDTAKDSVAAERHDVWKDLSGTSQRRPCIVEFADLGVANKGVDGLVYWEYKNNLYTVCDQDLYQVTEAGAVTAIASGAGLFESDTPVITAEAEEPTRKLFSANGGKIVAFDGTTAAYLTDGDAPTKSTHPVILDSYLISNDLNDKSRFSYSDVGLPEVWLGEYASAQGKPDDIQALGVAYKELSILGSSTLEPWYDDQVTPFAPIGGEMSEHGSIAPYTFVQCEESWFYVNHNRQVVRMTGRAAVPISGPIDNLITLSADVSTARGGWIRGRGLTLYTLSVGNTMLVYDYRKNEWLGEWNEFDQVTDQYRRFPAHNFVYVPKWNKIICGGFDTGKLYELSPTTYQDDGVEVKTMWRTGWLSHGTENEKTSNGIRIRCRRGFGGTGATLMLRWRDDGEQTWSNTRNIELGADGERNMYAYEYMLGSYNSRQYEISVTDNVQIGVVAVDEDIEVLSS